MCYAIFSRAYDGTLCFRGFDNPKSWESHTEFIQRIADDIAVTPHAVSTAHRIIDREYGIADQRIIFA